MAEFGKRSVRVERDLTPRWRGVAGRCAAWQGRGGALALRGGALALRGGALRGKGVAGHG